jgi:hypothetical protein
MVLIQFVCIIVLFRPLRTNTFFPNDLDLPLSPTKDSQVNLHLQQTISLRLLEKFNTQDS